MKIFKLEFTKEAKYSLGMQMKCRIWNLKPASSHNWSADDRIGGVGAKST